MAVIWIDGFDTYGPAGTNGSNLAALFNTEGYQVYPNNTFSSLNGIDASTRSGQGLSLRQSSSYYSLATKVLANPEIEIVTGFAAKYDTMNTNTPLIRFDYIELDGTHHAQMTVAVNTAGQIILGQMNSRYNTTTFNVIAASATNTLFPAIWYYVEIKYVIGAPGYVEVRVDGTTVLTFTGSTGMNDQATPSYGIIPAASAINCIVLAPYGGGLNVDDWYMLNSDPVGLHDFIGDHVVVSQMPTSDASPNAMTPSTAGSHYPLLADNSDATYVSTSAAAQQEFFGLSALPSNVTAVVAVQIHMRAQRDSSGVFNLQMYAETSSLFSTLAIPIGSSFYGYDLILESGPAYEPWTVTLANSLKIGFASA